MTNLPIVICLILFSYFCGAIPTGYLLVKALKHQDIRTIGSGNIGSTNVGRAAGPGASLITQIIDIIKGLIPVALALILSRHFDFGAAKMTAVAVIALASILGHDFSIFLKFRGGKGVNTTIGAFLPLAPIPVLAGIGVYYALRPATSIVSIRSLALGFSIAVLAAIMKLPSAIVVSSLLAAILIVIRHADNIRRLRSHNELR
jgi:acyl phosphate:glycerol-3-phosphate acyltransferase